MIVVSSSFSVILHSNCGLSFDIFFTQMPFFILSVNLFCSSEELST